MIVVSHLLHQPAVYMYNKARSTTTEVAGYVSLLITMKS